MDIGALWQPLIGDRKASFEPFGFTRHAGRYKWLTDDERLTYKPTGNLYGPEDIDYDINSEGYRCDELVPSPADSYRILFVGCSCAYGVGLPLAQTFGYRVVERMRNTGHKVPYWNISHPGSSIEYSVRALYQFLPRLRPNAVIAYFPPHFRREAAVRLSDNSGVIMTNYLPTSKRTDVIDETIPRLYTDDNILYRVAHAYAMFATLMKAYECDYLWNNWTYDKIAPEEYAAIVPPDMRLRQLPTHARWRLGAAPLARDGLHWGPRAHARIADDISKRLRI